VSPQRPPVGWRQLCAIATELCREDHDEWSEQIKRRLVALGFSYPTPHRMTAAMDAVCTAKAKQSPPPALAPPPAPLSPSETLPPSARRQRPIPRTVDHRRQFASLREIVRSLMPWNNSDPTSERSTTTTSAAEGAADAPREPPKKCVGADCKVVEFRGHDARGNPTLTIDPTTGLCLTCLTKMAAESRRFHSRRLSTQGALFDANGKRVEE
jgi:hypothetical protein